MAVIHRLNVPTNRDEWFVYGGLGFDPLVCRDHVSQVIGLAHKGG